jgi:hypothetical protein
MLIKILLLLFVLLIALYFLNAANHAKTQAWKKILFSLFIVFMVVATISPDITNQMANAVGVGRGADLLLYTLAVTFVFYVVNSYMKFKYYEHRINKLARGVAIMEAEARENQKRS